MSQSGGSGFILGTINSAESKMENPAKGVEQAQYNFGENGDIIEFERLIMLPGLIGVVA